MALFAAAAVTAIAVRSGVATSSAKAASPGNGLSAYVVLSNRGPLPPCPTDGCTAANLTYPYVHVINGNPVANSVKGVNRTATPNAYVLDSVDATILVNGTVFSQETLTPPPKRNAPTRPLRSLARNRDLRQSTGPPPCTTVLNPAILPDENTIGFYYAWFHAPDEPTGSYVFQFTLHGMLNGSPVDLTASSKPIQMT